MKKILSILLAALLLVSLFSCNTTSGNNNGSTTSSGEAEGSDIPAITLNAFDTWVKSLEGKELNNITAELAIRADFAEDPEETYIFVYKFTSTALLSKVENTESVTEDPNVVAGIINFFSNTLRAISECKDFTSDGGKFKRADDIKYAVTTKVVWNY